MSSGFPPSGIAAAPTLAGRYRIFHEEREVGEERWRLSPDEGGGVVLTGEQVVEPPHPFPHRHEFRATVDAGGRVRGVEILWTVGGRELRALHGAEGARWRVRIEYQGEVREQQGDYPEFCEVDYATPLFQAFILARRDFALGGEHEFPVLRIGPPWMAVSPETMKLRCVEIGTFDAAHGSVRAKRYVASLPPASEEEGYTFWADDDGFVLESYEGLNASRPWMRLVEFQRH